MTKKEACQLFPCRFPIKVIGENIPNLAAIIAGAMSSMGEKMHPDEMVLKHSKNKKYVSITLEIVADSREHVDKIYSGLNAQKEVKMVL